MCTDGSYSIKTSYKILCKENVHAGNASLNSSLLKSFWSILWKLKVPMKVKHFLWRACNDSLPTKFNLCKRKIVQDSTCSLCQWEPETIFHALWGSDEFLGVWQKHFPGLHSVGFAPTSIPELIDLVRDKHFNIDVFAMTCWVAWNRRNKARVREKSVATG